MPICEVGRSGKRKTPRRRRKKRKKARARRLGAGLKHHLSTINSGTKLGTKIYGAKLDVKVPAKSPPRLRQAQDLGAKIYSAETCKLGATNDGAELRVQILKAYLQGHICDFF